MSIVCPTRRKVLVGLGGLAAYSVMPAHASQSALGTKKLEFYNIHTRERSQGSFWIDGLYQQNTLENFSHLLRDHRQNLSAPMDKRLYELLYQLNKTLNVTDEYHVISGYRSPQTNEMLARKSNAVATKSYHMRGMAIDIAIPDVKISHLRDAAISLKLGGVGYYPKSGFVHVDTGRVRIW